MGILNVISSALKPAFDLIDNLHTSEDEKLAARAVLMKMENEMSIEYLTLKKQIISGQTQIIVAEAQSQSWLTRMWRPLMMVMFGAIIAHAYITGGEPPQAVMTTINIGLGGYIGGRSLEGIFKTAKTRKEEL